MENSIVFLSNEIDIFLVKCGVTILVRYPENSIISIAWSRSLNMFPYFKRDKDLLTHLNLRVLQQRKHLLELGAYLDCLQLTSQTAKGLDQLVSSCITL